jgi:hypothetical protein
MRGEAGYRLTHRVTGLETTDVEVVKLLLYREGIEYDLVLLEVVAGIAYVFQRRHPYRRFYGE